MTVRQAVATVVPGILIGAALGVLLGVAVFVHESRIDN